jgi:hypothetical protein
MAACGADTDDRPASFAYIHAAILIPNCATSGCHSTLTMTKSVDLEDPNSAYHVLTNAGAGHFDYQDLIMLLRGEVKGYDRMPPDQPLPEADILLIQRWIDAGRPNN